MTVHNIF